MPVQGQGWESLLGKSASPSKSLTCVGSPGSATNSMPGGQKARLVPPLPRLKAQKYHTGTKHIEQDKSPRTQDSFQSPSPACPCTPLPTPRLSADDSLEGLPPSQRPIARGRFWTLATSTCEGLTSRPLFPTILSKRSLHQTFLKHITLQGKAQGFHR